MPINPQPYKQYGGVWTLSQATDAIAQGKWPSQPAPHLYAWGQNNYGQLGVGNITGYSSPKQVGSTTTWKAVGAGYKASFAITTSGALFSWGVGNAGSLGLGNINIQYSSPVQVGSLTNWSTVTAGTTDPSTFAIKTDGTLWSWGGNSYGQLGLNNITNYSSPKQVGALTNWSFISCGYDHVLSIKTNGTLWSWGNNPNGQLGKGNTTNYSSPVQVGSLTNWSSISAGCTYSLATRTDGTLWFWGNGLYYGQSGLNSRTNYSSPVQIGALTTWLVVAAGSYNSYAIKNDGTLWSWGYNPLGQLGLGNTTRYSSPKQVGSLTNWSKIGTNFFANGATATKTDGTLWAWGYGGNGELGLGNATNYSSPKQLGALTTWSVFAMQPTGVLAIATT
jgi:alpha-tubulin suppressor-like RCC1 family protein